MLLLSQGPVFWRLLCLTLSLYAISHALKADTSVDTSASTDVVLHAEQTYLIVKALLLLC